MCKVTIHGYFYAKQIIKIKIIKSLLSDSTNLIIVMYCIAHIAKV